MHIKHHVKLCAKWNENVLLSTARMVKQGSKKFVKLTKQTLQKIYENWA